MELWPQKLGAKCESCPFNERKPVPVEPSVGGADIFLLGESPGGTEERLGRPFVGESGMLLNSLLSWLGHDRGKSECLHISNSILCRPLKHAAGKQWNKALACCKPRLDVEVNQIPDNALVITMGAKALAAMTGKQQMMAWRGYPLDDIYGLSKRGVVVYPTIHPAYVLRAPHYLPVIKEDFRRAFAWHQGILKPWVWPDTIIDEGPEMLDGLETLLEAEYVGVDVETAGDNPFVDPLLCVGLASRDLAISVPWPPSDPVVLDLVNGILGKSSIGKVLQNGNYDKINLEAHSLPYACSDEFDTLIAHRIVAPLLPHDLGFIASMELGGPRWKTLFKVMDDKKGTDRWRKAKEDPAKFRDMLIYNSRDAYMTCLLQEPLLSRLRAP